MLRKFQKKIENFKCENCGFEVIGSGYTNHCPKCLWSKHVDVFPGDREYECCGMMKPIGIVKESDGFVIVHKCQKCGIEKKNKVSKDDIFEEIVKISQFS